MAATTIGFLLASTYDILTDGFSDKNILQLNGIALGFVIYFALASIPFSALLFLILNLEKKKYIRLRQDLEYIKAHYEEPKTSEKLGKRKCLSLFLARFSWDKN